MLMILPAGTNLIDVLAGSGDNLVSGARGAGVADVGEAELEEGLRELVAGNIEFVILDDDGPFLQVAGSGDGPYALEHHPGEGSEMSEVPGGVDRDTARSAMLAYLRGESTWRTDLEWGPIVDPYGRRRESKRRGLFGRRRGN